MLCACSAALYKEIHIQHLHDLGNPFHVYISRYYMTKYRYFVCSAASYGEIQKHHLGHPCYVYLSIHIT